MNFAAAPVEVKPLADLGTALQNRQREATRNAAQDFESVFVSQMMEPMFQGLKTDGMFGGGQGEAVFRSLMIQEVGKEISKSGGVGISDAVFGEMLRMQGLRDSDLTERGRLQAQAMGRSLRRELDNAEGPTVFLRSPLGRARETAAIIGREIGLDPGQWRDDPRLVELGYGEWEGLSWKDIEITHPTALADWRADPHGYCPPGGEIGRAHV